MCLVLFFLWAGKEVHSLREDSEAVNPLRFLLGFQMNFLKRFMGPEIKLILAIWEKHHILLNFTSVTAKSVGAVAVPVLYFSLFV